MLLAWLCTAIASIPAAPKSFGLPPELRCKQDLIKCRADLKTCQRRSSSDSSEVRNECDQFSQQIGALHVDVGNCQNLLSQCERAKAMEIDNELEYGVEDIERITIITEHIQKLQEWASS